MPPRIETKSNAVTIIFVTDESGDHTGWKIHYTSTGEGEWVLDPDQKLLLECQGVTQDGTLPGEAGKCRGGENFLSPLGFLAEAEK